MLNGSQRGYTGVLVATAALVLTTVCSFAQQPAPPAPAASPPAPIPFVPASTPQQEELRLLLAKRYPGRELHLICDNYGTHKHPKVTAWLKDHPNFQLHFAPVLRGSISSSASLA